MVGGWLSGRVRRAIVALLALALLALPLAPLRHAAMAMPGPAAPGHAMPVADLGTSHGPHPEAAPGPTRAPASVTVLGTDPCPDHAAPATRHAAAGDPADSRGSTPGNDGGNDGMSCCAAAAWAGLQGAPPPVAAAAPGMPAAMPAHAAAPAGLPGRAVPPEPRPPRAG
jgi:hypothetical protein